MLAIKRLRSYRLKERYALVFVLIGAPFLVLALWPDGLGVASRWLHIQYQTVALICVTAFFLLIILELLTIVSQQDRKITTLAQMVGILMNRQNDLTNPRSAELKAASTDEAE